MSAPLDLVGQRFHMLVVIARIPSSPSQKLVKWKCQCDCGNETIMRKMVKRLLKKHKYPPEGMNDALETVLSQCEMWTDNA